jgi:hypothetical protein
VPDTAPRATLQRRQRTGKLALSLFLPWTQRHMTDAFPDRLSVNPNSRYYDEELLERPIGIRVDGRERINVEEYCISEGWIRVSAGKARDRHGNPVTIKIKGQVEPFFRDTGSEEQE